MPNIEIHGFSVRFAEQVSGKVVKCLMDAPFADETVITFCSDAVMDLHGMDRPYLRILSDESDEIDATVELLRPLNIEMECLMLYKFIPNAPQEKK